MYPRLTAAQFYRTHGEDTFSPSAAKAEREKSFPWKALLSLTEYDLFKQEAAVVLVDITPAAWITVLWVSQSPSCPKECLPEILINCFDFLSYPNNLSNKSLLAFHKQSLSLKGFKDKTDKSVYFQQK